METLTCIVVEDELNAQALLSRYIGKVPYLRLTGVYGSAEAAAEALPEVKPQVIFLDVQMPGKSGLEFLEELEDPEQYAVVFTTAYDNYAIKAFEQNAFDYLVKPFDEERFQVAAERIRKRLLTENFAIQNQQRLEQLLENYSLHHPVFDRGAYLEKVTCKQGSRLKVFNVRQLQYIEAAGNYSKIYTGSGHGLLRINISEFEQKLDPSIFVRIHRSFIVNLEFISTVETHFNGEYRLTMQNKEHLKVSRSFKEAFNKAMGIF